MDNTSYFLEDLTKRYPLLDTVKKDMIESYEMLKDCFQKGGKLLIAGNGGSAADSEHIVGELMKGFCLPRKVELSFTEKLKAVNNGIAQELSDKLQGALPAIALSNHSALNTAFQNDVDGRFCIAQQVYGYGKEGDVFLGISTSGNSGNIVSAAVVAKALGMKVIGLTGSSGGKLSNTADITIKAPAQETYKVQEFHLPIYHCLCLMLEDAFWGDAEKVHEREK